MSNDDEHYLYPIGLDVRHGAPPSPVYRIVDRRVKERDLFGGLPEYLLTDEQGAVLADAQGADLWVAEADVWPLETEEC